VTRLPPRPGSDGERSSTRVFHSPQPGQRPIHLEAAWPQSVQQNWVAGLAIYLP
jgi:hypothetical protein